MNKSEFYKKYYTRLENQELNEAGYPNLIFLGDPITTEEQWNKFLETEIELDEFVKLSPDAAKILGVEFVPPYTQSRIYPEIGEQLDGIYKALLAVKESGIDLGTEASEYLDSITTVKTEFPKN